MSEENNLFTESDGQGFVAGAIIGALAGSIAAMLLTPKTGREMRQVVKEYAKEWEGEAGDFAVEARQIITTIQGALGDGVEEFKEQAPKVSNQAAEKAAQAAAVVEETYSASRDTVSEMVETFRSQWAELEEDHQPHHHPTPSSQTRFRGVNRTWDHSVIETDDQKSNQAYVEELQEEVEAAETSASSQRPTLAQYRQASAKPADHHPEVKPSTAKTTEPPAKSTSAKKPAKKSADGRKLLFRRK
jgi:gas vesicle protein